MKFNIFTYEGFKDTNIGDYIQSLAARQFWIKKILHIYIVTNLTM